jgi:DNA polymerase I
MKTSSKEAMLLLHQGAQVLSRIESNGLRIDKKKLDESFAKVQKVKDETIKKLQTDEVYMAWKTKYGKVNLNRRKQLADILYNHLGYETSERTAGNEMSTGKGALEELDLPFADLKLKIDQCETVIKVLNSVQKETVVKNGHHWCHPVYNLHIAATYRSSCNNPNFMASPKRSPEMAEYIRPIYLAHPGHHFGEIDLAGAEVSAAACYTKDKNLIKYLKDDTTDMHRDTAMDLFCCTKEQIEHHRKTLRDSAKNQFVFPQFYGSVYFNCARLIWKRMKLQKFMVDDIPLQEHLKKHGIHELGDCVMEQDPRPGTFENHVKEVEHSFWHRRFKQYTHWKDTWREKYYQTASMEYLSGFVINNIQLSRSDLIDYPIQGFAFHWLLWGLIQMDRWLMKNKMKSKFIGEIHDSACCSIHPAELQDFLHKFKEVMTVDLPNHWKSIIVPIRIEVEVSPVNKDWYSCKQWIERKGVWCLKS